MDDSNTVEHANGELRPAVHADVQLNHPVRTAGHIRSEHGDHTSGQMSVIHGGAITTLVGTAMGWATYTVLEDNENFATADLQVQFVRGAKVGLLKARGAVVRRTRALAFCEGEIRDEGDQLVARGSAT